MTIWQVMRGFSSVDEAADWITTYAVGAVSVYIWDQRYVMSAEPCGYGPWPFSEVSAHFRPMWRFW